jgi:hypothetical protein
MKMAEWLKMGNHTQCLVLGPSGLNSGDSFFEKMTNVETGLLFARLAEAL